MKTLRERFDAKWIPEPFSGCWLWTGTLVGKGYGHLTAGRQGDGHIRAPRASWMLYRGDIPKGMCVLHRCDTPACVNPNHLFLGSITDNNNDSVAKGRWGDRSKKGEDFWKTKLTENQVRDIFNSTESGNKLGHRFKVDKSTINRIRRGKSWKHLNLKKCGS